MQGWDESLRALAPSDAIYFVESIPFEWLFSRVAAVVHHGGFGTTAAAFRAGVPAVAIPHVIDQFYWSKRIFELGVGPEPIARGRLKTENLRKAISRSLHDEGIREKAAELGRLIRAEPDGVTEAVSILASVITSECQGGIAPPEILH